MTITSRDSRKSTGGERRYPATRAIPVAQPAPAARAPCPTEDRGRGGGNCRAPGPSPRPPLAHWLVLALGAGVCLLFALGAVLAVALENRHTKSAAKRLPALRVTKTKRQLLSRHGRSRARPRPQPPSAPQTEPVQVVVVDRPLAVPAAGPAGELFRDAFRPAAADARKRERPAEDSAGTCGTSVRFVSSPAAADRLAEKKDRLRFVLHVSGNFEDPGCT